ncbi:MAG: outer membrane lipoprotein-sorting protein [Spirochaetota bacterium]
MKCNLVLFVTFITATIPLYPQSPDAIVEAADRYRGFKDSFAQVSRLTYYKNGSAESVQNLKVYVNDQSNSLVRFFGPGREKGRIMLMSGNNVWLYIPDTRNPIRLTPQQRLIGQASNGDVARTNYSEDYTAAMAGSETVDGRICHVLKLTAKENSTTYQHIEYFVEKSTNMPVKARFFAKSGKLLKTGHFRNPKTFHGRSILTELFLTDELRKDERTIIQVSEISRESLPAVYFNKNYLERIE